MLAVFILMVSTGITDGELQMAEPFDDEKLYTEFHCEIEATVLNVNTADDTYYFCLDYQDAAWNIHHLRNN